MSLFLDKEIRKLNHNAQAQHIVSMRKWNTFERAERMMAANFQDPRINLSARLPETAPVSFDRMIKKLMTGDEGNVILNDLLPLAKSLHPGKYIDEYAKVSDSGESIASLNGTVSKIMDAPDYDYEGTLSLIHEDAFGIKWREQQAYASEDFDAIMSMQENSIRAVRRGLVGHTIDGVAGVKYKNTQAFGLKNNPNTNAVDLGASGFNVDMTSSTLTYADAERVIVGILKELQGSNNNVEMDITFYVSSDIWFNLITQKTNDTRFSTFLAGLKGIAGVADIKKTNGTNALTGNQILAMALSSEFVQPIVAEAVNTTPMIRLTPYSDWNWLTRAIYGLHVKSDFAGRSGVAYARDIT